MKLSYRNSLPYCLAGSLVFGFATGSRAEDAGVVRIAKPRTAPASSAQPSPVQPATFIENVTETWDDIGDSVEAPEEFVDPGLQVQAVRDRRILRDQRVDDCNIGECPDCPSGKKWGRRVRRGKHNDGEMYGWVDGCPECYGNKHLMRKYGICPICGGCHRGTGCRHDMFYYFACKFGYLWPSGNGGVGNPFVGRYSRVYAQDVNYNDPRDGQLWAAQGYGVPISVPLAPTVGHSYNYSWGIPASRLTPISTVAPY